MRLVDTAGSQDIDAGRTRDPRGRNCCSRIGMTATILITNRAENAEGGFMSYIETPVDFPYPWYLRVMFRRQRRRFGRELEPVRLWARMPAAFLAMSAMYRALDRNSSPIESPLRSLVQVRISQINGCDFCMDLNAFLGAGRGVAQDKLRALPLFEDSALFDEREKAVLAYAEAATRSDRRVDPTLIARLRQHLDDQAIVELTALIAYQNMSSKFNAALGVPAHGFCLVPPPGALLQIPDASPSISNEKR